MLSLLNFRKPTVNLTEPRINVVGECVKSRIDVPVEIIKLLAKPIQSVVDIPKRLLESARYDYRSRCNQSTRRNTAKHRNPINHTT